MRGEERHTVWIYSLIEQNLNFQSLCLKFREPQMKHGPYFLLIKQASLGRDAINHCLLVLDWVVQHGEKIVQGTGDFSHHVLWHIAPVCETKRWEETISLHEPITRLLLPILTLTFRGRRGQLIPSFSRRRLNASFEWANVIDSGKINTRIRSCPNLQGVQRAEATV